MHSFPPDANTKETYPPTPCEILEAHQDARPERRREEKLASPSASRKIRTHLPATLFSFFHDADEHLLRTATRRGYPSNGVFGNQFFFFFTILSFTPTSSAAQLKMSSFDRTGSSIEAQGHIQTCRAGFPEYRTKEREEVRLKCLTCSAGDYHRKGCAGPPRRRVRQRHRRQHTGRPQVRSTPCSARTARSPPAGSTSGSTPSSMSPPRTAHVVFEAACSVFIEFEHKLELAGDAATQDDGDEDDGRGLFARAVSSGAHVAGLQEYDWIALKMVHRALFHWIPQHMSSRHRRSQGPLSVFQMCFPTETVTGLETPMIILIMEPGTSELLFANVQKWINGFVCPQWRQKQV